MNYKVSDSKPLNIIEFWFKENKFAFYLLNTRQNHLVGIFNFEVLYQGMSNPHQKALQVQSPKGYFLHFLVKIKRAKYPLGFDSEIVRFAKFFIRSFIINNIPLQKSVKIKRFGYSC